MMKENKDTNDNKKNNNFNKTQGFPEIHTNDNKGKYIVRK